MVDYVDSIKIGEGVETPIWDTAITVNGTPPDSTHSITLQPDTSPDSGSNNFVSSKALYNLLINNIGSIAEYSVPLISSDWENNTNTITVTVENSIINSNTILIISPAATAANISNYGKASIYCSGQGVNSLSFSCSTKPTSDITVNVLAINIRTSF